MTWLHEQRIAAVMAVLRESGAETILDLGCGDGALLTRLVHEPAVRRVVGIDVSADALQSLRARLSAEPPDVRRKFELIHGSMTEPDKALAGFDAAVLVEVIEHIDPGRLSLLERALFRDLSPARVIVTTPNQEFNALLGVPPTRFRHPDHRFEWGRMKFRAWAQGVAERNGYAVTVEDIAATHTDHGGATQMAVFERRPDRGRAAA